MRKSSRIRPQGWISRYASWLAIVFAVMFLTASCQTLPLKKVRHNRMDTSGRARGVAAQDEYAFVADGEDGLAIVNISNPKSLQKRGSVGLPGFAGRVAVEGNLAVVADATQNRLHLVDISDKFTPALKWTFQTLDIVREVAIQGGTAFLAESGDDFSGVEAISCSLTAKPASLNSTAIKDIRDVAATSGQVFVISPSGLTVLGRSAKKGFTAAPLATLNISSSEDLQSIDGRAETHLLILGKSLYLVDVTSASNPVVRDQATVSGYAQNRVVASMEVFPANISKPKILRFGYSTLHEYGTGWAELTTQKILFVMQGVDLDKESEGHCQLYDIEMRKDSNLFFASGDVFAIGALDNYGLGVAFYTL